jgi:chondroitin-sulfate-ABC endolyase/exolyase
MKFCFLLLLSFTAPLDAQSPWLDDFEAPLSPSWNSTASEAGKSPRHFKSGTSSLAWKWSSGDARLTFRDGQAMSKRGPKSGFAFWCHGERRLKSGLTAELLHGDQVVATGWFWMDFTGWRLLGASYAQFGLPADQAVDAIRLHAPKGIREGMLHLDDFCPLLDFAAPRTPQMPWADQPVGFKDPRAVAIDPDDPALNLPWMPARPANVTAEEKAEIGQLTAAFLPKHTGPGRGLAAGQLDALKQTVASYEIRRSKGIVTGRPIDGGTALKPAGHIPYGDYLKTCEAVKNAYHQAKEAEEAGELKKLFIDLTAHLLDQGWAQGIRLGAWDNYPGNAIACFYAMKDELNEAGLARPVAQALMDHFGSHGPGDFAKEKPHSSMDGLGFWHRELFACALMFPTPEEQVQHLRIASRFLSRAIINPDTIAPDGCTYHHGGFHYAYASYNLPRLLQVLRAVHPTSFRIDRAAHERLRTYVRALAPTFSKGQQAYNLGMRAGTSMASGGVATVARELALMGSPDGKETPDREMAAICLWVMADERGGTHPDFAKEPCRTWLADGIQPAIPHDHVTLNGAPVAVHRREDWLASIAGISPFWRGIEIYGWTQQNNYGRFARHGSLVITANGSPPNLADSGWAVDGWNWCHFPGTTALKVAASREIFDGYAMYGNGSPFAGGTSLGGDGIWGMDFTGHGTRFRKSYFCFDRRIVTLTSRITAEKKDNASPVVTTLFQNSISPESEFVTLDGEPLKDFPQERRITFEKDRWLIDNKGTGYLIPSGNDPLHLQVKEQEWLYFTDKNLIDPKQSPFSNGVTYQNFRGHIKDLATIEKFYRPTRGNHALAWFDHGPQPSPAACAYTVVVKTRPEEMARLAVTPTHRTLRFDERAHIVHDLASDSTGYVLFEAATDLPEGPLRSCDHPVFLMIRRAGGELRCSLASTMTKNADPFPEVPIRLVIQGRWQITDDRVRLEAAGEDTAITMIPRDNTPFHWSMRAP